MNDTTSKERLYSVYMHTNKIDGKKYIGITSQTPSKRWSNGHGYRGCRHLYNAIQKYGWDNFYHDILFTGLSKEDAESCEIDLIRLYKTSDCAYGYNITSGGNGVNIFKHSDEWKLKISNSHIGSKNPSAKHIVLIDNDYNLIKEYDCIKYAAEELGLHISHIQDVCEHRYTNTGGYVFMYYSDYIDMVNSGTKMPRVNIKPYRRPVNQYSLNGTFIKKFQSIRDAVIETNGDKKGISNVCKGVQKTSGGFKWEYAEI